ncbi:MAG: hypothetical protein JWN30_2093 [Bacilli bacterium]|nr:hypothetical protein [Bacilli bacterium]
MLGGVVANRYAEALFSLAKDTGALNSMEQELGLVAGAFQTTPEFMEFLAHPKISIQDKKASVEAAFAGLVSPQVLNFLRLLLDRQRENYLLAIYESFTAKIDEAEGRIKAVVESAYPLTDKDLNKIAENLQSATGKTVLISSILNESLIGGARIQVGDKVVDASVKGLLNQFRDTLKH